MSFLSEFVLTCIIFSLLLSHVHIKLSQTGLGALIIASCNLAANVKGVLCMDSSFLSCDDSPNSTQSTHCTVDITVALGEKRVLCVERWQLQVCVCY